MTTHGTVVVDHCKELIGPVAFKILIFNPWRKKFLADLQLYGAVDVLDQLLAAFSVLIQEVLQVMHEDRGSFSSHHQFINILFLFCGVTLDRFSHHQALECVRLDIQLQHVKELHGGRFS